MSDQQKRFPHLTNAPLTEAIIDFRVRLSAGFDVTVFKALHSQFQKEYPHVEAGKLIEHSIESAAGAPPSLRVKDLGIQGFLFRSEDGKNIFQFRKNGFTFNRLKPYTSWEQVFPEAAHFWKIYAETAEPIEISRIAVRYINRLLLPGPQLEFAEYLTAPPAVPQGVPQFVRGFASRLVIHEPDTRIAANIVQALEPTSNEPYVSVILDIDVYERNVSDLPPEAVLAKFDRLREMKNRIFFSSLTPKAIALFQ